MYASSNTNVGKIRVKLEGICVLWLFERKTKCNTHFCESTSNRFKYVCEQ